MSMMPRRGLVMITRGAPSKARPKQGPTLSQGRSLYFASGELSC
jgi:hypothetical protein